MGYTMLCRHEYQTFGKRKESLAKFHFVQAGYTLLSPTFMATKTEGYLTGSQLRAKLSTCPGWHKTPRTEDVCFITDQVMGIDFFIDCGHYVIGIDSTINRNQQILLKKVRKASIRQQTIVDQGLGLKILNKSTSKWYFKPILKIIIYSFSPDNYLGFNNNHMALQVDHTTNVNLFVNRS